MRVKYACILHYSDPKMRNRMKSFASMFLAATKQLVYVSLPVCMSVCMYVRMYSVHKKNRDSQNVVILVPKINIKVTPRLLNIELPYSNIILSHF